MELGRGTVIERYVIEDTLGSGATGMVYRARHQVLGTQHALKVLHVASAESLSRLREEGRRQSQLRHPNLVRATDLLSVAGDVHVLVLDYVDGPSLARYLAGIRPGLRQVDHLARGVLKGLAAAHRQGLVHRDVKPANILLDHLEGELVPRITDFGLAFALQGENRRTGPMVGTPHYMAPEQAVDPRGVDARADVFSAGVVLYELAAGRRPFDGDTLDTLLAAMREGRFHPIRERVPDLPERMAAAIDGALIPDRDRRIASCDALLAAWLGREVPPPAPVWTPDQVAAARSFPAPPPLPDLTPAAPPPRAGRPATGLLVAAWFAGVAMAMPLATTLLPRPAPPPEVVPTEEPLPEPPAEAPAPTPDEACADTAVPVEAPPEEAPAAP